MVVHVEIEIAVVVVIRNGHPQSIPGVADAGLLGHIGELEIPVVAVQGVCRGRFDDGSLESRSVEKVDVVVAIVVVVEEGQSALTVSMI